MQPDLYTQESGGVFYCTIRNSDDHQHAVHIPNGKHTPRYRKLTHQGRRQIAAIFQTTLSDIFHRENVYINWNFATICSQETS